MKKLVINLILFLFSILIFILLFIPNLIHNIIDGVRYKNILRRLSYFFLSGALAMDIMGNTMFSSFLNAYFVKKGAYLYGTDRSETISSVTGKNLLLNKLTWIGIGLAAILDFAQKDHCWLSVSEEFKKNFVKPNRMYWKDYIGGILFILLYLFLLIKIILI